MASNTPKLDLLKKDPVIDGNDTFNIQTMLNDNWDKIDNFAQLVEDELGNVDDVGQAVSNLIEEIGSLTELNTETKLNLISAINEVYRKLNEHKADKAKYATFTIGANQSIPNATDTQIVWTNKTPVNGEDFSEIDGATGKIKILKEGIYQLQTSIAFAGNATGVRNYWGTVLSNSYPNTTTPCYMTITEFIKATTGQLVNSRVSQTSGGALNVATSGTSCIVRKVI